VRARVHLARAIAHGPTLLILEHPTATLTDAARLELADVVVTVTGARQLATLVITQDDDVARRVANRALRLEPATGAVKPVKKGWFR
jgi:ABC-type iron transport system FetAB ATPase subunit